MSMSLQEQNLVQEAVQAIGQRTLASTHLAALEDAIGIDDCIRLARGACANDSEAKRRLFHALCVVRALVSARTLLRMPYASFAPLDKARKADPTRFNEIFTDAVVGKSTDAIAVIRTWVNPVSDVDDQRTAQSEGQQAPIHPTQVPPPARREAIPVGLAQQPSRPNPPSAQEAPQRERPTAPPRRDESSRAYPAPERQDNVRRIHGDAGDRFQDDNYSDHNGPSHSPAPVHSTTGNDKKYDQVVVYGRDRTGGTAMQCENSPTRDRSATTINLSIGRAKGAKTQDGVDWSKKLSVMLVPHEVTMFLAVLLGEAPTARFAGHGHANDKWIEVSETTDPEWLGQVTVSLVQGKGTSMDSRRCGITSTDIGRVIAIFNRAQMSLLPGTAPVAGHIVARRTADLYAKAKAAAALRQPRAPQAAARR